MRLRLWHIGLVLFLLEGDRLSAQPLRDGHTEVELVSEVNTFQPGRPFWVGIHMKIDPDWHTYWKNPGDAGLPTTVTWELPSGFTVGDLHWPLPQTFQWQGLVSYGYEGKVLLLALLRPPEDVPFERRFILKAQVSWLECNEVCLPGKAAVALEIVSTQQSTSWDTQWHVFFEKTRAQWPQPPVDWEVAAYQTAERIILSLASENVAAPTIQNAFFYPYEPHQIVPGADQPLVREGQQYRLYLTPVKGEKEEKEISGVLHCIDPQGQSTYYQIDAVSVKRSAATSPGLSSSERLSLAVLGLAFLGGLLLNLMPCVFPVIGLKIMGFVSQSGQRRHNVILHGVTFTAGILVSFWILAGILIALRTAGEEIGWGFQLQSPRFVFVLMVGFFIFALNLSGLFEIGQSFIGLGGRFRGRGGLSGSFFSGCFATVVATPCAAPFLAPALGIAFTLSPFSSLLTFTCIGLGLAIPYLLLVLFPGLMNWLPRPGAWMETFKQGMAFLLYATVGYLLWVLAGQVSESQLLNTFMSLVGVGVACWAYGRWGHPARSRLTRRTAQISAALLLISFFYLGYAGGAPQSLKWQTWSPEKVASLRAEGRPIYIDFTARWCATCQVNKRVVFSSLAVQQAFNDKKVVALKADWTERDPEITAALSQFGRYAVPFNLIYLPERQEPIILPELLTPHIVLEALESSP